MSKYHKHYPTLDDMSEMLRSKQTPLQYLVQQNIVKAEVVKDDQSRKDGFEIKFHFNLRECEDYIRNSVHEITEEKQNLYKFAHNFDDTRTMQFTIQTKFSTWVTPDSNETMTFEDLSENKTAKRICVNEAFRNLFGKDYSNKISEKHTIAKLARDSDVTPRQAARSYATENAKASTRMKHGYESDFNEGIKGRMKSFVDSVIGKKKSAEPTLN